MIIDDPTISDFFEFNTRIPDTISYAMYIYCPLFNWDSDRSTYPMEVQLTINSSSVTDTYTIDHLKNAGNWAYVGKFKFNGDEAVSIRVSGNEDSKTLIADAILLTPENNY